MIGNKLILSKNFFLTKQHPLLLSLTFILNFTLLLLFTFQKYFKKTKTRIQNKLYFPQHIFSYTSPNLFLSYFFKSRIYKTSVKKKINFESS